jgi:hypothetical protein
MRAAACAGLVAIGSCATTPFARAQGLPVVPREIAAYPFTASPERAAAIRADYQRVHIGMSPAEAVSILGEPDEIRPLLRGIKAGKPVGFSYWFVLRRITPTGSQNDKRESLVRVLFDLESRATRIDAWGL